MNWGRGKVPKNEEVTEIEMRAVAPFLARLDQLAHGLPPVMNSFDFPVDELEKPVAVRVFQDGFAANNSASLYWKFQGRWTARFQSGLFLGTQTQNSRFGFLDEAQINGPVGKYDVQLKFKANKLSGQLDLGHHAFWRKQVKAHPFFANLFWNPYIYLEADRECSAGHMGMGLMAHYGDRFRTNLRLNLRSYQTGFFCDLTKNVALRHNGLFANCFIKTAFNDKLLFPERRMIFGYEKDRYNMNVEVEAEPGSYSKLKGKVNSLSGSIDLRDNGIIAATLLLHEPSRIEEGVAFDEEKVLVLGYRNKISKNLEVRAKISTRSQLGCFVNYRVLKGMNIQASIDTGLTGAMKQSYLNLPFDFGLKIKMYV